MSSHSTSSSTDLREILAEVLKQHTDHLAEQLAQELANLSDDQLFGDIEVRLRDLALQAANRAHQDLLDRKKKLDTRDPAPSAVNAKPRPNLKDTPKKTS